VLSKDFIRVLSPALQPMRVVLWGSVQADHIKGVGPNSVEEMQCT